MAKKIKKFKETIKFKYIVLDYNDYTIYSGNVRFNSLTIKELNKDLKDFRKNTMDSIENEHKNRGESFNPEEHTLYMEVEE